LKDIIEVYISENNDGKAENIGFTTKSEKKHEIIHKYFGKKLLITDRDDWSSIEILKTYKEQDCIEKIFRDTKNPDHFSIRPQYHYTDQKVRVHIFCCLLGLTLSTILQKEVSKYNVNLSKDKLLDTLHNVRQCWIKEKDSNKVKKVLEEMNDAECDLWRIVSQL
jgi:transposase